MDRSSSLLGALVATAWLRKEGSPGTPWKVEPETQSQRQESNVGRKRREFGEGRFPTGRLLLSPVPAVEERSQIGRWLGRLSAPPPAFLEWGGKRGFWAFPGVCMCRLSACRGAALWGLPLFLAVPLGLRKGVHWALLGAPALMHSLGNNVVPFFCNSGIIGECDATVQTISGFKQRRLNI